MAMASGLRAGMPMWPLRHAGEIRVPPSQRINHAQYSG